MTDTELLLKFVLDKDLQSLQNGKFVFDRMYRITVPFNPTNPEFWKQILSQK